MMRYYSTGRMREAADGEWVRFDEVSDFFELQDNYRALSTEFDELSAKYDALKAQHQLK